MAAVAVAFDGTRLNDCSATTNFTAETATPTVETDFFYQGTSCISAQIKTAEIGFSYTHGSTTNFSSPARVWLAKLTATNKDALDGVGIRLRIGNDNTNFYFYDIFTATSYPIAGGFQIVPIDPNVSGHRTGTTGSPNLTTVDYFAIRADFSATSKAPNLGLDAIDYIPSGSGLTLTGGDGADADGTFDSYVTSDEGTANNRWGVVSTRGGVLYVVGTLTIGSATATVFTDSNKVLVFPDGKFNTGFAGIVFSLASASSVLSVTNSVFRGRGTQGTPDTRPDYIVSGTSGTLALTGCTFNTFRNFTLTSKATLTSCIFLSGLNITQSSAVITGCTISGATTGDGVGFISSDDPSKISSCSFTFSDGHAITITATGTYSFSANTFTGYGADGTNDAAIYNNSGGAVTINITNGGSTPTIRNGSGASTTVNNAKTITLSQLIAGSEVRLFRSSDDVELDGTESSTTSFAYAYNHAGDVAVYYTIQKTNYKWKRINATLTASDQTIPAAQLPDPDYTNP